MKSSLKKLRGGFGLHKGEAKEKKGHLPQLKLDELAQATQDMQDMRNCYDSLLSAAAATANSAYEFSEALQEMGACLLEKTSLNDDEESGRVLLMIGKAQFELQKLVDSYRAHVIQTITNPSESLLRELQTVEEMRRQCDDKRELYKFMLAAQIEKGTAKSAKHETLSIKQLQAAQEAYEEEATLFIFRLKSLKQGQSRSLLTQASRHHAAQMNFFQKAVKSLEIVEPHVREVATNQHIDYHFTGLEDNGTEDDDPDDYSYADSEDGELSFDYGKADPSPDVISMPRNSMELDQPDIPSAPTSFVESGQENSDINQPDLPPRVRGTRKGSQSAPILPDKKLDPSEKLKDMLPSSPRKFHTYALPTPGDIKTAAFSSSSGPILPMASSVLKESNTNTKGPFKFPPPLAEELLVPQTDPRVASATKKIKRNAHSGPLPGKTRLGKPDTHIWNASSAHQTSRASPAASPPPVSSPKITELHELPRPPVSFAWSSTRFPSLVGYSAPLVSRGPKYPTSRFPNVSLRNASPLPTPAMVRSLSIPSSGQRAIGLASKLEASGVSSHKVSRLSSPPLIPISLSGTPAISAIPETVYAESAQVKGL